MEGRRPLERLFSSSRVSWLLLPAVSAAAHSCRDRFLEPFSSESIWNTAIGSEATFAPARLFPEPALFPTQFHNDQDFFLRASNADPLTDWINQGDWAGGDKCHITGNVVAQIPFPFNWTTASDCDSAGSCRSQPGQVNNNAMGVLLPDNRSVVQMQPAYRCAPGAPLLARFGNTTDGCPEQFPNVTDVLGDGALGSHGGSGLSGVGGTIRLGELLPGSGPIRHALKLELQRQWYYGLHPLQPPSDYNGGRRQYLWPATGSDSGTEKAPGGLYSGTNPHVAPGALLAIPGWLAHNVSTSTVVGGKIKQALTDYGGYIVDGTGAGNSAAICMEAAVNAEMREAYGFAMTYPTGVSESSGDHGRPLYMDLLKIFQALHAVTNNAPGSVGGGGNPRVPKKPPICQTAEEQQLAARPPDSTPRPSSHIAGCPVLQFLAGSRHIEGGQQNRASAAEPSGVQNRKIGTEELVLL